MSHVPRGLILYNYLTQSSSSRSPTRPVQKHWWSWWSSSGPPSGPYTFWWSRDTDGHCAIRSCWYLLHLWRTCSVVWSSSLQGHVGEGTIISFLCMCALSRLNPSCNNQNVSVVYAQRSSESFESILQQPERFSRICTAQFRIVWIHLATTRTFQSFMHSAVQNRLNPSCNSQSQSYMHSAVHGRLD